MFAKVVRTPQLARRSCETGVRCRRPARRRLGVGPRALNTVSRGTPLPEACCLRQPDKSSRSYRPEQLIARLVRLGTPVPSGQTAVSSVDGEVRSPRLSRGWSPPNRISATAAVPYGALREPNARVFRASADARGSWAYEVRWDGFRAIVSTEGRHQGDCGAPWGLSPLTFAARLSQSRACRRGCNRRP